MLVKRFGSGRGSCTIEGGPATLGAVAGQGKLRNGQNPATHISECQIHLSGIIFKHPQINDLFRQPVGIYLAVPLLHAKQHQYTPADLAHRLARYIYPCTVYSLDNRFHGNTLQNAWRYVSRASALKTAKTTFSSSGYWRSAAFASPRAMVQACSMG